MKKLTILISLIITIGLFIDLQGQTNATSYQSGMDWILKSGYYYSTPSLIKVDGEEGMGGSILIQSECGASGPGKIELNAKNGSSIFFQTNGTSRMTINSNGKIGIGTDNPQETLHINGHLLIPANKHLR
jgi:hypothetical protein